MHEITGIFQGEDQGNTCCEYIICFVCNKALASLYASIPSTIFSLYSCHFDILKYNLISVLIKYGTSLFVLSLGIKLYFYLVCLFRFFSP